MEEQPIDWTSFKRRIFINQSVERVFGAWATAALIETWFLKSCSFSDHKGNSKSNNARIETGDTYEWVWHGWPEHKQNGEITKVIDNEEIGLTFGEAGDVTLKFHDTGSETELKLEQGNIPDNEFAKYNYFYGCTMGWSFWMVNLKAYLEHGIVLDERSGNYKGDMTVVNQ